MFVRLWLCSWPALACPQQKCNSWAYCHFLSAFEERTHWDSAKATNKGPLVLVWMMATLEPIPVTYGHRAWLRAHKCYSLWTLCQPMAHRINGQFRAGGQACPQHYMAWVNRARRQRNTPHIQGHSEPGAPFSGKTSISQQDKIENRSGIWRV